MFPLLQQALLALLLFSIGEILLAPPLFRALIRRFDDRPIPPANQLSASSANIPALKGICERAILYLALLCNFPQILGLFGALKIATRFQKEEDQVGNDFFLIGNLVSVALVMLDVLLFQILTNHLF